MMNAQSTRGSIFFSVHYTDRLCFDDWLHTVFPLFWQFQDCSAFVKGPKTPSPESVSSGVRAACVTCVWYECHFPLQMVCERSDVFASSCAIARAFPIFSRRTTSSRRAEKKHVTVEIMIVGEENSALDVGQLEVLLDDGPFFFFNTIFWSP